MLININNIINIEKNINKLDKKYEIYKNDNYY